MIILVVFSLQHNVCAELSTADSKRLSIQSELNILNCEVICNYVLGGYSLSETDGTLQFWCAACEGRRRTERLRVLIRELETADQGQLFARPVTVLQAYWFVGKYIVVI